MEPGEWSRICSECDGVGRLTASAADVLAEIIDLCEQLPTVADRVLGSSGEWTPEAYPADDLNGTKTAGYETASGDEYAITVRRRF